MRTIVGNMPGIIKCSVDTCHFKKSALGSNGGILFHYFPSEKNSDRRNKWIRACNRGNNWKPSKHSVICERHFSTNDYGSSPTKRFLSRKSIPNANLNPNAVVNHDDPRGDIAVRSSPAKEESLDNVLVDINSTQPSRNLAPLGSPPLYGKTCYI